MPTGQFGHSVRADDSARREIDAMPNPIRRLRNFTRRSRAERRLLVEALVVLTATRIALSVLPDTRLRSWLRRSPAVRKPRGAAPAPREIVEAVQAAARDVRGADCFAQALATRFLLARKGHPATIRISVGRSTGDRLIAHAWVATHDTTASCGAADLSERVAGDIADFDL